MDIALAFYELSNVPLCPFCDENIFRNDHIRMEELCQRFYGDDNDESWVNDRRNLQVIVVNKMYIFRLYAIDLPFLQIKHSKLMKLKTF